MNDFYCMFISSFNTTNLILLVAVYFFRNWSFEWTMIGLDQELDKSKYNMHWLVGEENLRIKLNVMPSIFLRHWIFYFSIHDMSLVANYWKHGWRWALSNAYSASYLQINKKRFPYISIPLTQKFFGVVFHLLLWINSSQNWSSTNMSNTKQLIAEGSNGWAE